MLYFGKITSLQQNYNKITTSLQHADVVIFQITSSLQASKDSKGHRLLVINISSLFVLLLNKNKNPIDNNNHLRPLLP